MAVSGWSATGRGILSLRLCMSADTRCAHTGASVHPHPTRQMTSCPHDAGSYALDLTTESIKQHRGACTCRAGAGRGAGGTTVRARPARVIVFECSRWAYDHCGTSGRVGGTHGLEMNCSRVLVGRGTITKACIAPPPGVMPALALQLSPSCSTAVVVVLQVVLQC